MVLALVVALLGCAEDPARSGAGGVSPRATAIGEKTASSYAERLRPAPAYAPAPFETYVNAKRLAAAVAQRVTTYSVGSSVHDVVARLDPPVGANERRLGRAIEPLIDRRRRSFGAVVYPQLAGVTSTTVGLMVVVRQRLSDGARTQDVTRVLDVRLRRRDGPWRLETIASVGGSPPERARELAAAERRVLDHSRINLSDSARWDIQRGAVDSELLRALARIADEHRLSVSVLISGHPPRVWGTQRWSAHSKGLAADIYAVDDRLLGSQREPGSPAYEMARALLARGAAQVGSPWDLVSGARSFTDAVHEDHLHLQQSPFPR